MAFIDLFRRPTIKRLGTWRELGTYQAQFSAFGHDVYKSDLVRSCIRPLAEHTSKANARCTDARIEKILNEAPNLYMTGADFLAKIRTKLEINNTVFIAIQRDDRSRPSGFYPIPHSRFEALEYAGQLFIKIWFENTTVEPVVFPWADLIVLRKDYNKSDIAGDDNNAILQMLDLINTTNQGVANAVKSTANLRGILKSTKAMLSPDDVKKQKDRFISDYLNLGNEGGIASLDSTQDFTPITMNPTVANWEQNKEFRENVYRYFGISDAIVTSNYTEYQMEAFYDSRIEPFLIALSVEMTRKIFTDRERSFGAQVIYEANRLQFSSTATKLNMVQMVDRGALTPNEWRQMLNLAPIEGGDEPIRRLDTAQVNENNQEKQNEAQAEEGEDDE